MARHEMATCSCFDELGMSGKFVAARAFPLTLSPSKGERIAAS